MDVFTLICLVITVLSALGAVCAATWTVWEGRDRSTPEVPPHPAESTAQLPSDRNQSLPG